MHSLKNGIAWQTHVKPLSVKTRLKLLKNKNLQEAFKILDIYDFEMNLTW